MLPELSLQVLLALGAGPAHGYAIGKDIETRSGGRLGPTTGALYQALKRLADDGFIRASTAATHDGVDARRKVFALTPAGRAAAATELRRLADLVAVGRQRQLFRAGAR
jgi:DNA-binding PadR family transcriptional regulator